MTRALTHRERAPRFVLVGLWNTAFGYGAYLACLALLARFAPDAPVHLLALPPAHGLAMLNSYVCQRLFVFADGAKDVGTLARFLLVYGVTFLVNLALLGLLVDGLGLPAWLGQAVALGLVAVLGYLGNLRYTFRVREEPPASA